MRIHESVIDSWTPKPDDVRDEILCRALEEGAVIRLAKTRFELQPTEHRFLSQEWSGARSKNISLRPGVASVRGAQGVATELASLGEMMARYADASEGLVDALFARYREGRTRGNTSFRPVAIQSAQRSWRSDDRRMHVDSFASNPVHGRRILRVFSNVHPGDEPREWLVGEPFADFASRFFPRVRPPLPGAARLLAALGITKRPRSAYDHFMLGMHDAAKADVAYQRDGPRETIGFAAGETWIAFTDQVVHAATRGQFALEQTFYVDVERMRDRAASPLSILERMAGRPLVE